MRQLHTKMVKEDMTAEDTARAYDQAADGYHAYADGDPHRLFSFEGHHAYADRHVCSVLETKLRDLRASGATSIHILDAGCGPGTWLRRLVTRAHLHDFSTITARGFDVSQVQVRMARHNASDLMRLAGVNLTFDVADLEERLPEPDGRSISRCACIAF
jgi:SAM-dependent methyltransferase